MVLKSYSQLTDDERDRPCVEYPGDYRIFLDGTRVAIRSTYDAARDCAVEVWKQNQKGRIMISWLCSANDPRIGRIWFEQSREVAKLSIHGF